MRHHRHIRKRPIAEINVVPYIDVMLVLLIIFMVTASLLQRGIDVDLPKADAILADHSGNDEILVINVDKEGQLYSQVGGQPKKAISLEKLKAEMKVFQSRKSNQLIYFGGDKDAKYGDVVQFFAILKLVGKDKLFLMTEMPDQ